jgi:hypothetical protein
MPITDRAPLRALVVVVLLAEDIEVSYSSVARRLLRR